MRKTKLLFAVQPKDAFSPNSKVVGNCVVKINEGEVKFIKNRSGFYCVTNMPAGEYQIAISNKFYCNQTIVIQTGDLDPLFPAIDLELEPNLLYAYPKGTTLLRGRVLDSSDVAIVGVVVNVKDSEKEFITDELGRFIFYFKEMENEQENVEVILKKPGFQEKEVVFEIIRGNVNKLNVYLEPE